MKSPRLWIAIIFISIIGLIVASRVFAPAPTNEMPSVEQTPPPIETTETSSLPDGWKKYDGGDFTIAAPETWIKTETSDFFSLASGVADDAYTDPDIAKINIIKITKNNKTLEEIISEYGSTEKTAEDLVELMQKEANPPHNEITKDDIKISREVVVLDSGQSAVKNVFQCLKICYIEGPAYTLNEYFVETPEAVFRLNASTATTEKTKTLLLMAEQVVKTFEAK